MAASDADIVTAGLGRRWSGSSTWGRCARRRRQHDRFGCGDGAGGHGRDHCGGCRAEVGVGGVGGDGGRDCASDLNLDAGSDPFEDWSVTGEGIVVHRGLQPKPALALGSPAGKLDAFRRPWTARCSRSGTSGCCRRRATLVGDGRSGLGLFNRARGEVRRSGQVALAEGGGGRNEGLGSRRVRMPTWHGGVGGGGGAVRQHRHVAVDGEPSTTIGSVVTLESPDGGRAGRHVYGGGRRATGLRHRPRAAGPGGSPDRSA